MSLAVASELMTAEEFLAALGSDHAELVEGRATAMPPESGEHDATWGEFYVNLKVWLGTHPLGVVTGPNAGFVIARSPDTVRVPDTAFCSWERIGGRIPGGYFECAPELVIEVVSPSDRWTEVLAKVGVWLDAGVLVVVVVWPDRQRFWIFRTKDDPQVLGPADTFTCEDVLPGFSLPVEQVFAAARRQPPVTDDGGGRE